MTARLGRSKRPSPRRRGVDCPGESVRIGIKIPACPANNCWMVEMTKSEKESLLLSAAMADAHGHVERARWYRIWAETGRKVGEKPDAMPVGRIPNGPES